MTHNQSEEKTSKKYNVDDLVRIGDGIHSSTTSFILVENDKTEISKGYIMFSSHGKRSDVIRLFIELFEKNDTYIEILLEAIATHQLLTKKGND